VDTSFFEPAGPGSYLATDATSGPWDPRAQHGGPPSALAARALDRHEPADNMRLARVTVDILRPVPVGQITVRTRTLRPGKRVALLETVLEAGGQEVLHARGWRLSISDVPQVGGAGVAPAIPAAGEPPRFPGGHVSGYLSQIEWRFVAGNIAEPGPCRVWARPRLPLLPAEELSPMSRALLLSDSGSGVSMVLDPREYLFINVDLTVVLQRDLIGEWLMLDAVSTMGGTGTGLSETSIWDTSGMAGLAMQTLLVGPR
jgi:acyl-Coa thioesterase superfamily protein/acyl-CoA thioesterase superfamily protein